MDTSKNKKPNVFTNVLSGIGIILILFVLGVGGFFMLMGLEQPGGKEALFSDLQFIFTDFSSLFPLIIIFGIAILFLVLFLKNK